jgi:hypothetical protein
MKPADMFSGKANAGLRDQRINGEETPTETKLIHRPARSKGLRRSFSKRDSVSKRAGCFDTN